MRICRIRVFCLGTALSLAFIGHASAGIIESTYDFTASADGNTQISPVGGPFSHTDPANPGFCVDGAPPDCASGSGLSGSVTFADSTPTLSTITFTFFGSTGGAAPGSFEIVLGNFVTTDGSTITGVTYASGNLFEGDFSSVVWNGTDAIFTGSSPDFNALGGVSVVFNVDIVPAIPVPSISVSGAASLLVLFLVSGVVALRREANRLA